MHEYRKQIEELLQEREEGALGKWKSNEAELTARAKYEEDVRVKYPSIHFRVYYGLLHVKIFSVNGKAKR